MRTYRVGPGTVGLPVGAEVVGMAVGVLVGAADSAGVGAKDGALVGDIVDGARVGDTEVGARVGVIVVGARVGDFLLCLCLSRGRRGPLAEQCVQLCLRVISAGLFRTCICGILILSSDALAL